MARIWTGPQGYLEGYNCCCKGNPGPIYQSKDNRRVICAKVSSATIQSTCSFVNLLVFLAGCLQKLQSSQFAADDGCRHHSFQRHHCYESCGWLQP